VHELSVNGVSASVGYRIDAFTVETRPALDSMEAAVDRTKMFIYKTAYEYGLPCPINGSPSSFATLPAEGGNNKPSAAS
jgi:cytochrome c heme-lyase